MNPFARFFGFASYTLPGIILFFGVFYLSLKKHVNFSKLTYAMCFFMAWFFGSIPGFLYGNSAYQFGLKGEGALWELYETLSAINYLFFSFIACCFSFGIFYLATKHTLKQHPQPRIDSAATLNATDLFEKGRKLYKSGNYQEAINAYTTAIELAPRYVLAYFNRAAAYHKLGNEKQMLINLKTSAKLGHRKAQELLKLKGIKFPERENQRRRSEQ